MMNFLHRHFACIFEPRVDGNKDVCKNDHKKETFQSISTLTLKDYLKDIPVTKSLNDFLDSIPYSSNYLIEYYSKCNHSGTVYSYSPLFFPIFPILPVSATIYCACEGYSGRVYEMHKNNIHRPTENSFRKHIELYKLNHNCELGLTEWQVNRLKGLKTNITQIDQTIPIDG